MFPLFSYGHLEFKEMQVDVHPQAFPGKVAGTSFSATFPAGNGFSVLKQDYLLSLKRSSTARMRTPLAQGAEMKPGTADPSVTAANAVTTSCPHKESSGEGGSFS